MPTSIRRFSASGARWLCSDPMEDWLARHSPASLALAGRFQGIFRGSTLWFHSEKAGVDDM